MLQFSIFKHFFVYFSYTFFVWKWAAGGGGGGGGGILHITK